MATIPWLARRVVLWGFLVCLLGGVAIVGWTWNVPEPLPSAAEPDESSYVDALEAARLEMVRRVEAKQQAAEEVLAGRLTLAEAADRFRAIRTEIQQRYLATAGPFLPNALDEELLCREVIDYAMDALRDRPDEAEKALARLDKELRDHLAGLGLTREGQEEDGLPMSSTNPEPTTDYFPPVAKMIPGRHTIFVGSPIPEPGGTGSARDGQTRIRK